MINNILQWTGTACLLTMYVLMSFFPEQHPWNLVAGMGGGVCYLMWSLRTQNRPQVIVNIAGVGIALAGLVAFNLTQSEVPRQSGVDREIECRRMLDLPDA